MKQDKNVRKRHALAWRLLLAWALVPVAASTAYAADGHLPVAGIDHVNIHVPDVQRSAEFYTKLFGVEVSRAPNAKAQTANPASPSGVLWFIRLGQSNLAISPLPAGEGPGIDHYSFAIAGFNGEVVKKQLTGLNQQYPEAPSNNLWLKDPVGHVIQLNAPGDPSRVPGAGVGAVLVEPPGGVKRQPAFQATRISLLTVAVPKLEPSEGYYRKLLGDDAALAQKGRFRAGQAEFILGPASGGDYFRIGVDAFDPSAVAAKLKSLGVAASVARDKQSVSFRDPDGIKVEIGR